MKLSAPSVHNAAALCASGFLSASMFSHTVALRFLLLFAAAGLLVVAAVRARGAIRCVPPLWPVYAAWATWALLSVAWSPEPNRALKEFRHEILYTALAFWVCFAAAQAPRALRAFLSIGALGALVACAVSLYAYTLGWWLYADGWHGGAGNHSSLLLSLMPCALATLWYALRHDAGKTLNWTTGALIALFAAAAYGTQNRTIWLGFGAEVLLMLVLLRAVRSSDRPETISKKRLAPTLIAAAILAGTIAAITTVQHERASASLAKGWKEDPRIALWSEVLEHIEARPLTGYGFGRGGLRAELRQETGDGMLWHAHNIFLDVAVQLGIPGLALFLLLLAATFREAWRLCRARDDLQVACGIALAAVIVGMLVRNMTDVLWIRQNSLVYWGLAGALLGLSAAKAR